MALEIVIVKGDFEPYWEDPEAMHLGYVNPVEWESFFFKDLGIKRYTEYVESDLQSYDDYYSTKISMLEMDFPLISRVKDYYEDAFFSAKEIPGFIQEVL